MDKKSNENLKYRSSEDEIQFASYEPVLMGDWLIKASVYGSQIQMFACNIDTQMTIIRWFTKKGEAGEWLEHLTDL